jgi:peptidyl-prolyl cis-trans isomerase B (cyclophilin B)
VASTKRERELARLRAQRQAARRAAAAAERRKRRNTILVGLSVLSVAAVIAVIALVTGGGDDTVTANASPTSATGACSYSAAGTASKKVTGLPSTKGPEKKADTKVVLTTNRGEIDLTLHGAKAPCTTNSFTFLAGQKYFDDTSCHRLTTTGIYVLQCGDPTPIDSTQPPPGSGGPGYQFADENLTGLGTPSAAGQVVYPRGTVAMANSGPGTNGSQFFLVYKDSPLAPNYTPFGTITKGLDLLDTVAKAGASSPTGDGKPKLAVTIKTAKVES